MKISSFLLMLLFPTMALADVSRFAGQVYKKADYDQCLKDYDSIFKRVQSIDGFSILDGGCLSYGPDHFRLAFDYIHASGKSFDDFSVSFSGPATCLEALPLVQSQIEGSGNLFVSSHCQGQELVTHYVDSTFSVIRTLNKLGKFDSKAECDRFLETLTQKAKAHEMTAFVSICEPLSYATAGKKSFYPVFHYISFHAIEMSVINGKVTTRKELCLQDQASIERNFTGNKLHVVHSYCAGSMSGDGEFQETILFLKPTEGMAYVTEYEGTFSGPQDECEIRLEKILAHFNTARQTALYGHCKKLSEKVFRPTVKYLKTIEL